MNSPIVSNILDTLLSKPNPLSPKQKEAVLCHNSHIRIIAGAGAGKTETLTRRIAKLLLVDHVSPSDIVAFTFTEKAANSMKSRVYERVKNLGGENICFHLGDMFIGTIHGYCNRILESEFKFGNHTILDDKQEMAYLMRVGWKLGFGQHGNYSQNCNKFLQSINVVYSELLTPEALAEHSPEFFHMLEKYEAGLEQHKCLTFNLLIQRTIDCLEKNPAFSQKIKYLIVDEYQDINRAQEKLIQLLGKDGDIFIVGDPRQTIYQWRGSDEKCFDDFTTIYPDAKTILIQENRRSTCDVIEMANQFADTIIGAKYEHMIPTREKQGGVYLLEAENEADEVHWITQEIQHLVTGGFCQYKDIALLMRSVKTSAPPYVDSFQKHKIPFIIGGKVGLFRRPEIRAIGMLFCWISETGFWQDDPYQVSSKISGEQLFETANTLWTSSMGFSLDRRLLEDWKTNVLFGGYENFTQVYFTLLSYLGYDNLDPDDEVQASIMSNMGKFNQLLTDFETPNSLGGCVDDWEKATKNLCWYLNTYAMSNYEEQRDEDSVGENAVQIMTIHQSKGLEWPIVFIPALVTRRFPSSRSGNKQEWFFDRSLLSESVAKKYDGDPTSERKLFYVAQTRAKDVVIFSRFQRDTARRRGESVFLSDIRKSTLVRRLDSVSHLPACPYSGSDAGEQLLTLAVREVLDYRMCPQLYRFRHVWGYRPGLSEYLGYGSSLHFCLREMGEVIANRNLDLDQMAADITRASFHLPYMRKGGRQEKIRKAAVKHISAFVQKYTDEMLRIRDVETHIEFEHENAILSGQVDVVLRNEEEEDAVEVWDYKTGYETVNKDYVLAQLYLYCHGLRAAGKNVIAAAIAYIKDCNVSKVHIVPQLLTETMDEVGRLIQKIREGQYVPHPDDATCRHCDYKVLCTHCSVERDFNMK